MPNDPLRRKRALRHSLNAELRRLLHRARHLERQPWKAEQHYRAVILKGLKGSDDHDAHRIAYSSLELEKELIRLQGVMSRLEPDSAAALCVRRGGCVYHDVGMTQGFAPPRPVELRAH